MAQDTDGTASVDPETGEIVVVAPRLRGQVDTDVPPLLELDEEDIEAYGVGSIEELVEALEPASGSSRGRGGGRPVFLVNGIRIGSFREFRSYPPEAIRKVEVLPEEVAQRFGFPPDRRVINFILKPDFQSREIEAELEAPDRGGYVQTEQEFTWLRISPDGRLNVNLEHNDSGLLTEAERDIVQTAASIPGVATDPDPAAARSLVADSRSFEATANWAAALVESGTSLTLSTGYEHSDSLSLSGLDSALLVAPDGTSVLRTFDADNPLTRETNSDTITLAGSYARALGDWQLTATLDSSVSDSRTRIDRAADTSALEAAALAGAFDITGDLPPLGEAGFDTARTRNYAGATKATLRGRPVLLPAGELGVTLDAGYDWSRIESSDTRSLSDAQLTRGTVSGGVNVNVPIASRREGFLEDVGELSANFQARADHLSDFGMLFDWSAGLNWQPLDRLSFSATYVNSEAAPSLSQLGDPQTVTLNVPVFDLARGETSLVTVTDGGNPLLPAESQSDWKLSANWELPTKADLRLNVDYIDNTSRNVASSFPSLTPASEAAFPGRVTRAADGTLVALDTRPVTFAETRARRLVFGLTMRGQIGAEEERGGGSGRGGGGGGSPAAASPATGGTGERGGGMDDGRFVRLQERFCGLPEGQAPNLDGLPDRFLQRLRAEDGTVDPARVAEAQERICSADGPPARGAEFAQLRERFCAAPEGTIPDLAGLPERLLERLRGEDGEIDPVRVAQARERICGEDGETPRASGEGGGNASAPAIGLPGRGDGPRRPRYFLNLSHSVELENTILVAEGGPVLDQLDGDATSTFGLPRHSTTLEGGLFLDGIGVRASANYLGSTRLSGSGLPGSSDLFIDDLATLDLRLFMNLGEVIGPDEGLLKDLRLSLRTDNVFDGRRAVRDGNGEVPLRFQPLLIDPVGRFLGVELRKLF
ncbi:TonB-dependent receptor [Erythrobacteraceae bacterium WH01K]|nr:TonB-dependent receptor [Erythrobacteraceae bacterium WH01K]